MYMYVWVSYLTLDACQTACAGLWLTKALAVTSTGLPGKTQNVKLLPLLIVYALNPRSQEESLSLSRGVPLKDTSILQLSITNVDVIVFIWNLVQCESAFFSLFDGPTCDKLEPEQETN